MVQPRRVALTVELDPGPGPIRGRIASAPDVSEAFAGWLEFSTVLERFRRAVVVMAEDGSLDRTDREEGF